MKILFFIILGILFISTVSQIDAEILFEEVTNISGISYIGKTWGCSWGDFNGDGWPDVFCSNHGNDHNLYLNNKNGTFSDAASKLGSLKGTDPHGASWADFDNDGDQDLIILTGADRGLGENANFFFENDNGFFSNNAKKFGLDNPQARGRTPLWFDFNSDGLLDVFQANFPRPDGKAPSSIFRQTENGFSLEKSSIFEIENSVTSAQISDIDHDRQMDLIFLVPYSEGIYDLTMPFENKLNELKIPKIWSSDLAISDFNGDLLPDLFLSRTALAKSFTIQENTNTIKSFLTTKENENGFTFKASGDITFNLYLYGLDDSQIFIGSEGFTPQNTNFTLSSDDPSVFGLKQHEMGKDLGIYIGYDTFFKNWKLILSSNDPSSSNIIIKTKEPIEELKSIEFFPSSINLDDKLFLNSKNGFEDVTEISGLDNPTSCVSVTTGDFDNDMDVDIYLVCSTPVTNNVNILYENKGDGTFLILTDPGIIEGSNLGIGDTATTVDYDNDGFLDLLVTNGFGLPPFSDKGPTQLFRNLGNENHWIKIDLVGTKSNKDGIGARVIITTDGVSQLREQNGGTHNRSQNHQLIHVGLGNNTIVDNMTIYWPSGIVHKLENVPADKNIQVIEPIIPIPPLQQIQFGIEPKQVICKEGLELVFKSTNDNVACVKPSTKIVLESRGWAFNKHFSKQ